MLMMFVEIVRGLVANNLEKPHSPWIHVRAGYYLLRVLLTPKATDSKALVPNMKPDSPSKDSK